MILGKQYFQDRYLEYWLYDNAYTHHEKVCDYIEAHSSELLPPILKEKDNLFDIALELMYAACESLNLV